LKDAVNPPRTQGHYGILAVLELVLEAWMLPADIQRFFQNEKVPYLFLMDPGQLHAGVTERLRHGFRAHTVAQRLIDNISLVIFGKRQDVELAVAGFLAQGRTLIEDVPGVGKTMPAKNIARSAAASTNCNSRPTYSPAT
jgi:hypothetical protein